MVQGALRQLDYEWVQAAPTCPPSTEVNAGQIDPVIFTDIYMLGVEVYIPPGPAGQCGFQYQLSGGAIFPFGAQLGGYAGYVYSASDWVTGDNLRLFYELGIEVDQTFRIMTYNIGLFPHTLQHRFKTAQIVPPAATVQAVSLVPITQPAAPS
jgi:hypothetical protein